MSTVVKDLGAATAYGYAVEKGYTGTEAEFAELMASYATVGQTAVTAAQTATTKASEAATSATTATNKASEATTAATTATNKAAEAQADADAAALDASQAMSAASTATTKASEATTAAATAVSAKTDAVAANTAAQSAKTAAQTAQTGAETAAASVQSSAAQIQTNADDISELKEDTTQLKSEITDVNAELADVRVSADGVTYGSAGAAVRGQINDVNEDLENLANYQYNLSADDIGLVFENYDLSATTEIVVNNTRLTTKKKINTKGLSKVTLSAPTGYRFRVVAYKNTSSIAEDFSFGWQTTRSYDLMFPYFRIVLAKTSGDISPSEASNFTITFTKEVTDYSEKEMSLMMDKFISADIIKHSFGQVVSDPTSLYAYDPYQSGTFENANAWVSSIYRCVSGDSIELVSLQETSMYIFATFGKDGVLNHYDNGSGINNLKKISYTFTDNDKYFRVTCRRLKFRYAYVKYHSKFNNNRYVPDYAKAEFETVLSELQNKMLLGNPIVFGFNTDQHSSVKYEPAKSVVYGLRTMKMLSNEIPFDFHCLGGDAPSYLSNQVIDILNDVNAATKQMIGSACPVIPIVGNHDAIDNNANVTNAELFNVTFKRAINNRWFDYFDSVGCNAYRDDAVHAVRYIFIDSIPRTGYLLSDVNAFLSHALSTLPAGYNALIISHRSLNTSLPSTPFGDAINCAGVLETYAEKIIACISGHSHQDGSETINGILYICTTTAGLDGLASDDTRLDLLGTANETAYDVFVIDQDNLKIYAIRYGYGSDRNWTYTLS